MILKLKFFDLTRCRFIVEIPIGIIDGGWQFDNFDSIIFIFIIINVLKKLHY